jgi:hypothetical protein
VQDERGLVVTAFAKLSHGITLDMRSDAIPATP